MKKNKLKNIFFEIKYTLWIKPKDFFIDLDWIFRNIKRFWYDIVHYRPWGIEDCADVFCTALEGLRDDILNGYEEERAKMKKVEKIEEVLLLLNDQLKEQSENYIERECVRDYKKALEIEENRKNAILKRVFDILVGQDEKKFNEDVESKTRKIKRYLKKHPHLTNLFEEPSYEAYVSAFDGTNCDTWWS